VTLLLNDSIEEPRADASAAIRQQDTTGDSYVAFEPGTSEEPLGEVDGKPTIPCNAETATAPCEASLVAPRFDDLLNAFGPEERAGIQLILTELSTALDERGEDVNAAALELRPALVAANDALAEVNRQNAALRPLIEDAENVTGQASAKRSELAKLIESLETTLAVTASEADSLDAGLEDLPETLTESRPTLAALRRAAIATTPLARDLRATAPQLATALDQTPGFLDDSVAVIRRTTPTLKLTRGLLRAGTPTIEADPTRVVTGAFDLAPAISNLLKGTLGNEHSIRALFGDDSGGVPGAGTLDEFGLGAVTTEPGQAGFENRNMFRISAVLNCTMFGLPVESGCLQDFVNQVRAGDAEGAAAPTRNRSQGGSGSGSGDGGSGDGSGSQAPSGGGGSSGRDPGETLRDLLRPGGLNRRLDELGRGLGRGLGGGRNGGGSGNGGGGGGGGRNAVRDLLDYLLR
jgi:ABC-type transporter Mla subunit MlaD